MKTRAWISILSVVAFVVPLVLLSACSKDPVAPPPKGGPACIAASDSIVGWWPLDALGSGAEELVHGYEGDYVGGPLEAEGKVAGALRFDGVDDLVNVTDPGADWVYDITGDITLETWIERDTDQPGQQVIAGKYGAYYLGCRGGRIFSLIPNAFDFAGATKMPTGEWLHIAVTYDVDAKEAKIYLNGEVNGTVPTSGQGVPVSSGSIYFGGLPGQQYFDGYIDEVSVYKTALTTAEIREIYNKGALGKCK